MLVKVYQMRISINQEKRITEAKQRNVKKKILIVGDSIVKHIDGWRLNKSIRSTVSVRLIPGATTKT